MKNWIYILSLVFLASCGSADMAENTKVSAEPMAKKRQRNSNQKEFNIKGLKEADMEEYLHLKVQDLMELQAVLHNPEFDSEMKEYAKDMILKIFPDKMLLQENYRIKAFNASYVEQGKIVRSDGHKNKAFWNTNLITMDNDTINASISPQQTEEGVKFTIDVQIY